MLIFQGLFIFVFHCLMNVQVINDYFRYYLNCQQKTAWHEPGYENNLMNHLQHELGKYNYTFITHS